MNKKILTVVFILFALGTIFCSLNHYLETKKNKNSDTIKYKTSKEMINYYKNNYNVERMMYLLKDIDADNNIDLIAIDNCEVIVVANCKEIKEVGRHDFVTGTIQFYESASKKYPGIFYSYASGGRNYYGYLSLKNNKLAVLKLWNKDYSGIYKETGEKKIEYQSKNEELINESKNSCKSKYMLKFKEISSETYSKERSLNSIKDENIKNVMLNKTKYYNTATKKMEYVKDFKYTSKF